MGELSSGSEWNEQQLFARLFFMTTAWCKEAQSRQDVMKWKKQLDCKMSLVMGIAIQKEKEDINNIRVKLNKFAHDWAKGKDFQSKYYDALFLAESDIDTIAHKYLPFLKLKKKADIRGL